jgi:DNA-binding response OmpR family regulator
MDGYEVCRRIKSEPWGEAIHVDALTGWGQEQDREKSRAAGFDHHLVKPVEIGEISRLIASLDPSPVADGVDGHSTGRDSGPRAPRKNGEQGGTRRRSSDTTPAT